MWCGPNKLLTRTPTPGPGSNGANANANATGNGNGNGKVAEGEPEDLDARLVPAVVELAVHPPIIRLLREAYDPFSNRETARFTAGS